MVEDRAFSSVDLVVQCLVDKERSFAFDKAIREVIKPHHTVLDMGTGSGIMALFAARAGAKKVIAVELDEYIASVARKSFQDNRFSNIIELFVTDGRNCSFEKETMFDVVIMEMLTTGMVDEFQSQAVKNLWVRGVVSRETVFLPLQQKTYVTPVFADFNLFGFKMEVVKHLWKFYDSSDIAVMELSEKQLINAIDFSNPSLSEHFEGVFSFLIKTSGMLNGIVLSSQSVLTENIFLGDTFAINAPVLIPVSSPRYASAGEEVCIKVRYTFGGGYQNFHVELDN
jgi:predicted RNA methylase